MSTFSKTAFIATLALGTSIGLATLQVSGVGFRNVADLFFKQASQSVRNSPNPKATKSLNRTLNSVNVTFEPDPNDPPTTTGGSGTR